MRQWPLANLAGGPAVFRSLRDDNANTVMSISGRVEDLGVAGILQLVDLGARSGILHLEGDSKVEIHFSKGRVIAVRGSETQPVGELLVDQGLIDRKALLAALVSQKADGKRRPFGEVLMALGMVRSKDLLRVVQKQIQTTVQRVLSWEKGTFSFIPLEAKAVQSYETDRGEILCGFSMSTQGVLLEAARITDDQNRKDSEAG